MPDTPDETPSVRQTAMQVAQSAGQVAESALNLAHAVDNDLGENVRPALTQLRQDLTDVRQELNAYQTAVSKRLDAAAESVTNLDNTTNLDNVLARLETAERTLADQHAERDRGTFIAPEDNRVPGLVEQLAHLRGRVVELEEGFANPPKFTLDSEQAGRIIERAAAIARAGTLTDDQLIGTAPVGKVHGKVLTLMRMVTSIGKERQADLGQSGGRFKFRGVDDAMDAVGHAMREVGLTLQTKMISQEFTQNPVTNPTRDGGTRTIVWTSAHLVVRYIFVCPEDGSTHTFEMAGEGRDASDKATSKAGSMALKYGLFQALMIPVTGLDDSDTESPQVAHENRPAQPDQPVSTPPAAPDQATRQQRARDALAALRALDRLPVAEARERLTKIREGIEREGLGTMEVDGATLRAHGAATARTLPTEPTQANQDDPPWNP